MVGQPVQPMYQLTRDDRITTLQAELFNLRARPPQAPASGIRTRGQKAREQEEVIEEIVAPTAQQTTPEASAPVVSVASIPAKPPPHHSSRYTTKGTRGTRAPLSEGKGCSICPTS